MVDGVRNVSLVAVEVRFYLLPRWVCCRDDDRGVWFWFRHNRGGSRWFCSGGGLQRHWSITEVTTMGLLLSRLGSIFRSGGRYGSYSWCVCCDGGDRWWWWCFLMVVGGTLHLSTSSTEASWQWQRWLTQSSSFTVVFASPKVVVLVVRTGFGSSNMFVLVPRWFCCNRSWTFLVSDGTHCCIGSRLQIASSRHGGLKSWDSRRWFLIAFAETAPIGLPAVMVASETWQCFD